MMKYKVKYKLTLVLGNVTCLTWTMWLSSDLYLQVGYWTENFTKLFLLLSKTLGKLHSVVWASNLNFKKFLSKYFFLKMQLICYHFSSQFWNWNCMELFKFKKYLQRSFTWWILFHHSAQKYFPSKTWFQVVAISDCKRIIYHRTSL